MALVLLFVVPIVLFSAVAVGLVAVLGWLVPMLYASYAWAHFMMDPWFQAFLKMLLLVIGVVMPLASMLTWMERKQSAMIQDRVGPNRASLPLVGTLKGIPHFVADALKMIFKEDFVPAKANKFLFTLAPVMAIVPVFVVFAIVPFGGDVCTTQLTQVVTDTAVCPNKVTLQVARLDVGLLFYFAIASLAVYGTTLAGWSSYNKWSLLGGLRASSQMMSYEVTMGMAILGAFLVYGTLEPHAIAEAQGPNPLHWGIVTQPLGMLLFFTAAIAETKRTPFDTPEGESEVIGYFVEYSGMRFGMFFLAEFIEIVFLAAIMATVFFGGYHVWLPVLGGLHPDGFHLWGGNVWQLPHIAVLMIQTAVWGLKVVALCWLQILIRWTLPRIRPDQLMSLGWKKLLPISIANVLITAAVVLALLAQGK